MRPSIVFLIVAGAFAQQPAAVVPATLSQVKRIYVAPLIGNQSAEALRQLLISSIDSTKLFVLTDNPERADAELRGAAEDDTYVDTYDSGGGLSTHESGGRYSGSSGAGRLGGYLGTSGGDSESHHIRERKHEAYATVRLCNRDGDVLWSTTQESPGAKFRGASADVATRVARQLVLDVERSRTSEASKR